MMGIYNMSSDQSPGVCVMNLVFITVNIYIHNDWTIYLINNKFKI
jgi:hypothetical protein